MIKKIRQWLINRAEIWVRATLQSENDALRAEVERLRAEIGKRDAYIQGLQFATRALRRIIINTGGDKP